jgi:uncharacterized RDD family membrane protein YckC
MAHAGRSVAPSAYASPGRRLLAWCLDCVVAGIVFIPLNPALYASANDRLLFSALAGAATVLGFACLIAFDGGQRGATPGKRIVGIRVADADRRGPIGYRRAAIRRAGYIIGGLVFFLGWIWALFDHRRQAWHDKRADSIVIRSR